MAMFSVCMKHGRALCSECDKQKTERNKKMNIFKLQTEVWKIAEEKGWHEGRQIEFGEFIALCHSELSEALEVFRVCGNAGIAQTEFVEQIEPGEFTPRGVPIELADVILRILDYSETHGINIQKAIETKMEFNKTRPYRHGGKVI